MRVAFPMVQLTPSKKGSYSASRERIPVMQAPKHDSVHFGDSKPVTEVVNQAIDLHKSPSYVFHADHASSLPIRGAIVTYLEPTKMTENFNFPENSLFAGHFFTLRGKDNFIHVHDAEFLGSATIEGKIQTDGELKSVGSFNSGTVIAESAHFNSSAPTQVGNIQVENDIRSYGPFATDKINASKAVFHDNVVLRDITRLDEIQMLLKHNEDKATRNLTLIGNIAKRGKKIRLLLEEGVNLVIHTPDGNSHILDRFEVITKGKTSLTSIAHQAIGNFVEIAKIAA